MSVVPMQKVRCIVHHTEVNRFLQIIQRSSAVEFLTVSDEQVAASAQVEAPHHALHARIQHAVTFLAPFVPKVGLLQQLREGVFTELTEAEIERQYANTDAVTAIVSDLEELQVEFAELEDALQSLEERHRVLKAWQALPMRLAHLATATTKTYLISEASLSRKQTLETRLRSGLDELGISYALTVADAAHIALTLGSASLSKADLEKFLETESASIVTAPAGTEMPEVELVAVEEQLAKKRGERGLLYDQAEHFAITHLKTLQVAGEVFGWEQERYAVLDTARATSQTVVFDGWLNADKRIDIEAAIAAEKLTVVMQELPLAPDEEPPVDIKNHTLVQPFEAVTRLYGMPGYRDLDPTMFLAGFFFLFFGLSLTDVGYGLSLVVVAGGLLWFVKLEAGLRSFLKLLLYVGIATVLVGGLFGGYFGIAPEALPEPLRAIQLFDPIGNPLPVFYLALSLGVFQVIVGLFLKIYSRSRQGLLVEALLDEGPWLFLFGLGILYILQFAGLVTLIETDRLVTLVYLGVGALVLSAARHGSGIVDGIMKALGALYGSVGFLSDVLSYSRLLALGLATTALAFAVNLIAEIVYGTNPVLGPIFALLILIIGHVFTLAVNTLGAFIHSARLQFVEFFGKFIDGTGREFSPLRRKKKYISIRDD